MKTHNNPAVRRRPHQKLLPKEIPYTRRLVSLLSAVSPQLAARLTSFLYFFPKKVKARISALNPAPERIEISTGTGKVHRFYAWGQGPTVLFIHGWGGCGAQCKHLILPLVSAGLRLATFDAPAHGENKESTTNSIEIVECVKRFAASQSGLEAIVAHSFGSIVALKAMSEGVAVSSLALLAPPDPDLSLTKFAALLGLSDKTVIHHRRLVEQRFRARGIDPWVAFSLARLATVKADPLVVHDKNDNEIGLDEGRRVAQALGASQHLVTTGYGHNRLLAAPEVIDAIAKLIISKAGSRQKADVQ